MSKEETSICVKDVDGVVLSHGESASTPAAIFSVLKRHRVCPAWIVLETGRYQSGEMDYSGRILKMGDKMLHRTSDRVRLTHWDANA